MRNKKVYCESGYKLTKGETESDLTKYLGGKKAHLELIDNIDDVLESYKWIFVLTALAAVAIGILIYILVALIRAGQDGFDVLELSDSLSASSDSIDYNFKKRIDVNDLENLDLNEWYE